MSNIIPLLNGLEFLYPENKTISQMKKTLTLYPESEKGLVDAFSIGQLKSKLWLIEQLPTNMGLVFICAGWLGTLANLMFERSRDKFDKIRNFDIDKDCYRIADNINRQWVVDGWQFKASTLDILKMNYPTTYTTFRANGTSLDLTEMPDTIINTSCEHINEFSKWYEKIPKGVLLVLQSNDYFEIDDHVNCSISLKEFAVQTPMTDVVYQGELELPKYKRFMRIGYK
jgi:hypothetical protein